MVPVQFRVQRSGVTLVVAALLAGCGAHDGHSTAAAARYRAVGVYGDLNSNGIIDAADATRVLRAVVGLDPAVNETMDFNGNGQVDAADATKILRVVVGLDVPAVTIGVPTVDTTVSSPTVVSATLSTRIGVASAVFSLNGQTFATVTPTGSGVAALLDPSALSLPDGVATLRVATTGNVGAGERSLKVATVLSPRLGYTFDASHDATHGAIRGKAMLSASRVAAGSAANARPLVTLTCGTIKLDLTPEPDGSFAFGNLPPGQVVQVSARLTGYASETFTATTAAGSLVDVGSRTLAPVSGDTTTTLAGRLLDSLGKPVARGLIALYTESAPQPYHLAITASDGAFTLFGVERQLWTIYYFTQSGNGSFTRPPSIVYLDLAAGGLQWVDVVMSQSLTPLRTSAPFATYQGRVVDGASQAQPGAMVALVPLCRYAVADADGRFSFPDVPSGSYTLHCGTTTANMWLTDTAVSAPATTDLGDIALNSAFYFFRR